MDNRAAVMRKLVIGDVVYATAEDFDGVIIGLVTHLDSETLYVRAVATQLSYQFDIVTGAEKSSTKKFRFEIISVAPLSPDIYGVVLGLDRKMRLSHKLEDLKLTEAEKKMILFVQDFYPEHPLPLE